MIFKKDEGSSFLHVVIVWAIFAVAIIVTIYIYAMSLTSTLKTQMENDLTIANLSASTIDTDRYVDTGKIKLTDVRRAYRDFIYTFTVNMGLHEDESNLFNPNEGSYFDEIISNLSVVDFSIYNVDESIITVDKYNINSNTVDTREYSGTEVFTPDGVKVVNPTIYSKVEVTLMLPGHITKTVTRENSVAVVTN